MHVLVAYSQPHGRYGRFVFTIMIYFSQPTEKAEIEVIRPQKTTETKTVYSCGYCGRWHTVTVQQTTTTPLFLPQKEYRKSGKLEFYRYDNVEPDDWIELTLRNSELLKYQYTKINIGWNIAGLQSYWRETRREEEWDKLVASQKSDWDREQAKKYPDKHSWDRPKAPQLTQEDRQSALKEPAMRNEVLYEVSLLAWDPYMQSKTDKMRVEEELINQTMNAEKINITELLLEPKGEPLELEGGKHFIEGELSYPHGHH